MKKILLTVMVVGLVGLTGCGAVNTTKEKAEVKTEVEVITDEAMESSNELIDDVEEYYEECYTSEEFIKELELDYQEEAYWW